MSHPAWVCGLKHCLYMNTCCSHKVTPCVGVWIETIVPNESEGNLRSHPAWVCGLKQTILCFVRFDVLVTPCVGVWIETIFTGSGRTVPGVTPCVGVWIETKKW